jgi:hypothetical protein
MNPYFIAGSVLAVVLSYGVGHWRGDSAGQAKVQQQWDHEKAQQMAEYAKAQEAARERERQMQAAADELRQEKDRELKELNQRAASLSSSLLKRTERPTQGSGVSQTPGSGQVACTGKDLYREDGQFLARIAREADELRVALKQCYSQYEAVAK